MNNVKNTRIGLTMLAVFAALAIGQMFTHTQTTQKQFNESAREQVARDAEREMLEAVERFNRLNNEP